jgi:hypothetical protein
MSLTSKLTRVSAAGALAVGVAAALAGPAAATGGQSTWSVGYGSFTVKSWHCSFYVTNCDWRGETILTNNGGRIMDWIQNAATVKVHGVSISSLNISKSPSASITFRTTSTATVTWRKYVANNVYNSGNVYAGYTSTYVSVNSCGSGNGPGGYGLVSSKCVYAGAL